MNKRGLNSLVASVLLILLVVLAIALMWTVIRGQIENVGEEITSGTECLNLDIEIEDCVLYDLDDTIVLELRRGADGVSALEDLRFFTQFTNGEITESPFIVTQGNHPPQELETTHYNLSTTWPINVNSYVTGVMRGGRSCPIELDATKVRKRCTNSAIP